MVRQATPSIFGAYFDCASLISRLHDDFIMVGTADMQPIRDDGKMAGMPLLLFAEAAAPAMLLAGGLLAWLRDYILISMSIYILFIDFSGIKPQLITRGVSGSAKHQDAPRPSILYCV